MRERFDDGTPVAKDRGTHYSEKGGHRLRGVLAKSVKAIPPDLQWLIRRSMRRVPQAGKY